MAVATSQYAQLAFALFAAVCRDRGLVCRGQATKAWICLTVGLTGWAVGAGLWIYYELIAHEPPFPSLADVGYLTFPSAQALRWCCSRSDIRATHGSAS